MIDKKAFGRRLKAWRQRRGMKQKVLCEMCKISQGSLSEIETGKSLPSADTIANMIEFTEFPVLEEFVRCWVAEKGDKNEK